MQKLVRLSQKQRQTVVDNMKCCYWTMTAWSCQLMSFEFLPRHTSTTIQMQWAVNCQGSRNCSEKSARTDAFHHSFERPPKPPTIRNSYTRTLVLDGIMKLSGTIGVTQKTMTFDTHVCQIFEVEDIHPAS